MRRALALGLCAALAVTLQGRANAEPRRAGGTRTTAAHRVAPGLLAGAHALDITPPIGVPLAGYGGAGRRLLLPDFLNRYPYAFWFKPSTGVGDPIMARALVLRSGERRVLWVAVDLVGVDSDMVRELGERLAQGGHRYDAIILSASHTHSGPGAFSRSRLLGFLVLDRLVPEVRELILDGMARAARQAESRKVPARVGTGRGEVRELTRSRVGLPLDPEVGVLKVLRADGAPVALLWNYAIHGTLLGKSNRLLSGDVMGTAARELEQVLGVPALYTNGASGDVSPALHGRPGMRETARALSREVLATWRRTPVEPDPRLSTVSQRISLPPPRLSLRNCLGGWVPGFLTVGLGWAFRAEAEMVGVAVGSSAWVTIPGELQTRLGETVKAEGRRRFRHAFVVGFSNDYAGYFLTPEEYRQPRYIACGSLYGEAGGRIVSERATEILGRLADLSDRGNAAAGRR
jgi:hypothetical protein